MTRAIDRKSGSVAIAALLGVVALACATPHNSTLDRVRADLQSAETDPAVRSGAPVELYEAKQAVERLEAAVKDDDESEDRKEHIEHLGYVADQKIQIARAAASEATLKRQAKELTEQSDEMRIRARTTEAERANDRAAVAEQDAAAARAELEAMRARAEQIEVQFQSVKTEETSRGLVLTMRDDVLFAFDSARLQPGAEDALDEVANFLKEYPDRAIAVEGHTDSVGSDAYNDRLSRERADSVAHYLEHVGVPSSRIDGEGFGEQRPVAPNDNEAGRQQNRRVESVVENPRA